MLPVVGWDEKKLFILGVRTSLKQNTETAWNSFSVRTWCNWNKTVDGRLKRNSRPSTVLFYFSFISPCATGLTKQVRCQSCNGRDVDYSYVGRRDDDQQFTYDFVASSRTTQRRQATRAHNKYAHTLHTIDNSRYVLPKFRQVTWSFAYFCILFRQYKMLIHL